MDFVTSVSLPSMAEELDTCAGRVFQTKNIGFEIICLFLVGAARKIKIKWETFKGGEVLKICKVVNKL